MDPTTPVNVALFDMDGSLADYEGGLLEDLEALRSPGEPPLTRETLWANDHLPHVQARMNLIKSKPGWWLGLKPIAAGMAVLELCRRFGFEIHVLTKGPKRHSNAWAEKVQWCQRHVAADVDIHITSDKGMVYGKILYDDYPEYLLRWLAHRPRGLGIMPVTRSNQDFTHPNVVKFDGTNFEVVCKAILAVKDRQPGQGLVLGT